MSREREKKKKKSRMDTIKSILLVSVNNWSFVKHKQCKNRNDNRQTKWASQVACRILIGKRKSMNGRLLTYMHITFYTKQKTREREKEEGRETGEKRMLILCYIWLCTSALFSLNQHREESLQAKIFSLLIMTYTDRQTGQSQSDYESKIWSIEFSQ